MRERILSLPERKGLKNGKQKRLLRLLPLSNSGENYIQKQLFQNGLEEGEDLLLSAANRSRDADKGLALNGLTRDTFTYSDRMR